MFKWTIISAAMSFAFVTQAGQAQSAKPQDVLLVVDQIERNLTSYYESDLSALPDIKRETVEPRRPRHVYTKASEVFLQVQRLRRLHGLAERPLPAHPVNEVSPGDVRDLVAAIGDSLKDVQPFFRSVIPSGDIAPKDGVTPSDVYLGLRRLSMLLSKLGLPPVAPNDVYRVALRLELEAAAIVNELSARGFDVETVKTKKVSGKSPVDAYLKGHELAIDIAQLVANKSELSGVSPLVLLSKKGGKISPADVLDLANSMLADLGAVKVALGLGPLLPMPEQPSGVSPSDVYSCFERTRDILKNI